MIPLLLIRVGTAAAPAIILAESLEYTARDGRLHYVASESRWGYRAPEGRAHYKAKPHA